MPTNPLWLEHTERAAWDTVQALRQQIEAERARVEQFSRLQESWPKLLGILADLRSSHGLSSERPHDLVEELGRELERVRAERDALLRSAEQRELRAPPLLAERADGPSDAGPETSALALEQFVTRFREHSREREHGASRSHERLLDALETKLDELEQASRRELTEHALELAQLAYELARCASRQRA
jgi:hypothetical protein